MPFIESSTGHAPFSPSRRRLALGLPLAAAGLWLIPQVSRAANTVRQGRTIMGTAVDIHVNHRDTALAQQAAKAAFDEMQRLEQMMSRYVPGNTLSALHASAGIQAIPIPAEMSSVLQAGQAVAAASQGAVSIKLKRHAKFACRMLDAEQRRIAWRYLRQALRDRAGEQTSAGHAHRAKHAD